MIKPNSKTVFIKADGAKKETDDGILISEDWKDLPATGTVVVVADDVTFCKAGDRVFFERYGAIDTPFGDDVRACTEKAVLAVFEDDDALL